MSVLDRLEMYHDISVTISYMRKISADRLTSGELCILNNRLDQLENMQKDICSLVDDIGDSLTRNIVELRYIKGLSIDEVADMTYYSTRTVQRIIKKSVGC